MSLSIKCLHTLNQFANVDIVVTQDISQIKLSTFTLPSVNENTKINVPSWLAKFLMLRGLAVIDSESESRWIERVHWREKVQPPGENLSLSPLPKDFYPKAMNMINALDLFGKDPIVQEKLGITKSFQREIVLRRSRIISELALFESYTPTITDKLTFEEQILLRILEKISNVWKEVALNQID